MFFYLVKNIVSLCFFFFERKCLQGREVGWDLQASETSATSGVCISLFNIAVVNELH